MSDDTKTGIVVLFVAGVIGLGWAYIDDKLEKARKQPKIDYSLLRKIENENPDVEAYEPPVRQQYDDEDGNDNGNNDYPDDYAYNEDYDGSYDQSSTNGRLPQADYSGMSGDDIDYHNTMRQAYSDALDQSKYPKGSYVRLTPETQKAMNRDRTCSVNGQVYIDASGNPVGGDAGFGFNITIGSNVFNYIPIIATATWQFQYKQWEFPLTAGIGFAWELYNGYLYWPGLILEAQAGAQYRIDSNWAAGGELTYMFMPQFNQDPAKTKAGHFIDVTLLARYYF